MAELWQSYGSWIAYGFFFIVMLLLHGRMHGHGGHGEHSHQTAGDPTQQAVQASTAGGHPHGEGDKPATRTRHGCC